MGKKPAAKAAETAKKTTTKKAEKLETKPKRKVVKVEASDASGSACKIKSCKREYKAKGYCKMHYKKWRQGEYGVARYKTCSSSECRKPMTLNRHGFCEQHYQSFYVKGEKVVVAPVAEKPAAKPADKTAAA